MQVRAGTRWRSAVCETEVVVVRAPHEGLELGCGGAALLPIDTARPDGAEPAPGLSGGTELGKRYGGEDYELLCTKPGAGTLTVDGEPMPMKAPKSLPSSD
jgi:hypothetical protein